MKCEICKQNEATVSINHMAGEAVSKLRICESCAAKKGLNLQVAVPLLTDLILGMNALPDAKADASEKACPVCRIRLRDFRKTSLLGCPACYDAFEEEVAGYLEANQKGGAHVGKVPACHRLSVEVSNLQKSLHEAVRTQDFEEAARLRDRMQELKDRQEPPPSSAEIEGAPRRPRTGGAKL